MSYGGSPAPQLVKTQDSRLEATVERAHSANGYRLHFPAYVLPFLCRLTLSHSFTCLLVLLVLGSEHQWTVHLPPLPSPLTPPPTSVPLPSAAVPHLPLTNSSLRMPLNIIISCAEANPDDFSCCLKISNSPCSHHMSRQQQSTKLYNPDTGPIPIHHTTKPKPSQMPPAAPMCCAPHQLLISAIHPRINAFLITEKMIPSVSLSS